MSTVKHAHHAFDVDQPGKDSYIHREAGATEVLVASGHRFALMHELRGEPEPRSAALLARLAPVDLVLVEGFKRDAHPKLEIHRSATGKPLLHPGDPHIRAIATDAPGPFPIPRMAIGDTPSIADWLVEHAAADRDVSRGLERGQAARRGCSPAPSRSSIASITGSRSATESMT